MSGGSKVDGLTPPGAPSLASLRFLMHMQGPACFCRWLVIVENAGPGHVQFRRRAKPAGLARPGRMRAPPAACRGQNARYDDRYRHLRAVMLMRHAHARKYSSAWRALLAFRTCRVPAEHRFHATRVKGTIRGMHYPKALHHRLVVALLLGNLLDCTYKSWESRAGISDVPR